MVKKIKTISIICFLLLATLLIKKVLFSNISTVDDFRDFMQSYGIWGPFVLTFIQAFQVVVPVLPGYLGCAVGAVSYGPLVGFICNYVGICAGSVIAYLLAEKYGKKIVTDMFSEKQYDRLSEKVAHRKSYDAFLFMATLLPLFPDDFLCYFSGLINMNRKRFVWIILLGKPWCILGYSIAFGLIQ